MAEKVAAGHDLDLDEALALSRASLPLLGRIIKLRPPASDAGDAAAGALPIDRVAALPESPTRIGQPWPTGSRSAGHSSLVGWTLARRLTASCKTPFLVSDRGAHLHGDRGCDATSTGVEVLRAIALARLVLPAAIQVQAPLATLGPKLAQVALEFGASHLGYVAPEGQTPSDPLIAIRACSKNFWKVANEHLLSVKNQP